MKKLIASTVLRVQLWHLNRRVDRLVKRASALK